MNDSMVKDIRYIKLHFRVRFPEDSILPVNKVSALRGGMGEMLLRANCIRDRNCTSCDFESECIVRRTMYSKMEIQPAFMNVNDSIGYVLECEDYHDTFAAGEDLSFQLILFGKTIVYFNQFLLAFYALGQSGIGKHRARFEIISVSNSKKEEIIEGANVYMGNYKVGTVDDYVRYRLRQIGRKEPGTYTVRFQSPLALKYDHEMIRDFRADAVFAGIQRRIYMLDCFEGIESSPRLPEDFPIPDTVRSFAREIRVKRHSNRTDTSMTFEGIEGEMELKNVSEEALKLLLAGELIHIGKNTSFGFGRYRVK